MSAANLLENGDFKSTNGDSAVGWRGFGNSGVSVHPKEKYNGKNCCITSKRTKNSYGPCQDVLYTVHLGCRYKFSAYVKLDPDLPESSTENIRVQLQYQLTSDMKNAWIRVASTDATSNKWTQISGMLVMPENSEQLVGELQTAILYFGGPAPDVNFMVANVELASEEEDDETENLLQNPDFNVSTNGHPNFWYGFGKSKVCVHPQEKMNGKNVCLSTERNESYGGLAQNVLGVVSLGSRYKFSASIRLHPDIPVTQKHNINVKLQYRLSSDQSFRYIIVSSASGVTSESWIQVKGKLSMPPAVPGNQLTTAVLYFGNVPTEVSFMVAETRLSPEVPAEKKPSFKSLKISRECSDGKAGAPVFISYQWDIQKKVKQLKEKLEKCGIQCWMDIGQMGGGDALYSEIDKGMRTAKVIIACVTRKYSKSENCQREVTLADCLKKPIIPLNFDDQMQWPPEGQMSMIFAKLLYINVCGGDDENEIPATKFQELLGEIKERM